MSLFDDLDELASAYLDGETTAEETARVESDADLMARVEELRAFSEAVAQPVTPPSAAVRDAAIAAALAASSTAENVTSLQRHAADQTSTTRSAAVSLEQRQNRWERFSRVGGLVAAAVAGIAVIGLAITSLGGDRSSTVTDTASGAMEAVTDAAEASGDSVDFATDAAADSVVEETEASDDAMSSAASMAIDDDSMSSDAMSNDAMSNNAMADSADEAMEDAMDDGTMEEEAAEQVTTDEPMTDAATGTADDAPANAGGDAEATFASDRLTMRAFTPQNLGSFASTEALEQHIVGLDFSALDGAPVEQLSEPFDVPCPDVFNELELELAFTDAGPVDFALIGSAIVDGDAGSSAVFVIRRHTELATDFAFVDASDCLLLGIVTP